MGCYHHLSLEEREDIMCLSREGLGPRAIARKLGRDKSTVSRELRRNACRSGLSDFFCRASTAQRRYEGRRLACRRPRLLADGELRSLVQCKILADRWSPEQVAGRLALEAGASPVSRSTIYRAIARRELDTPELARTARGIAGRLRHRGERRHRSGEEERRGKIRAPHEISECRGGRQTGAPGSATGRPTRWSAGAPGPAWSRSWTGGAASWPGAWRRRTGRRRWPRWR